jgi:hypothetical protein
LDLIFHSAHYVNYQKESNPMTEIQAFDAWFNPDDNRNYRQCWAAACQYQRGKDADRAQRQAEPSMMVAFDEGVKEPRIVSWNRHPTGTYWLYSAPQPAPVQPLTREQRDQIAKDNEVQGYSGDYYLPYGIIDAVEEHYGIGKE